MVHVQHLLARGAVHSLPPASYSAAVVATQMPLPHFSNLEFYPLAHARRAAMTSPSGPADDAGAAPAPISVSRPAGTIKPIDHGTIHRICSGQVSAWPRRPAPRINEGWHFVTGAGSVRLCGV